MKKIVLSCVPLVFALCSQTVSAVAVMDRWGTGTSSSIYKCLGPSQGCSTRSGYTSFISDGNSSYQQVLSSSSIDDWQNNNTRAIAEIENNGVISLPHLRGESLANQSSASISRAYALEGFTYRGVSQTVNLNIGLEGTIYDPIIQRIPWVTSILSNVYLFTDALALETSLAPGEFLISNTERSMASASESLTLERHGYTTSEFLTDSAVISFDLEDGDTFYLYSDLTVTAGGPNSPCYGASCTRYSSASSMNSLNLDITTSSGAAVTGLTANSSVAAVPVPAAVWLMGSALMGLVGFRRKKAA